MKWYSADILRKKNPQPPPFIVDEILPVGLSVLAAPGKTGKSWLCLQLCDAVATSQSFWGYKTCGGDVLYLALEDSWSRLNSRLLIIGSTSPANLDLVVKDVPSISNGLIDGLAEWAESHENPRLIVIDTLARVKGGGKPGLNAYEADYQLYSPLQEFAATKGIAVIGVTHFSKARFLNADDPFERITGSMGLFSVADCTWIITGKRGAPDQTLEITGRDVTDQKFVLSRANNRWQLEGTSEAVRHQRAVDSYKADPVRRGIISLTAATGTWMGSAEDFAQALYEMRETVTVLSHIDVGRRIGAVIQFLQDIDGIEVRHGQGGRAGRSYTFTRSK